VNEIAFPKFESEELIFFNFVSILKLIARPAESSDGLTILVPEERRNSDLDSLSALTLR